jgi:hypothetical protein
LNCQRQKWRFRFTKGDEAPEGDDRRIKAAAQSAALEMAERLVPVKAELAAINDQLAKNGVKPKKKRDACIHRRPVSPSDENRRDSTVPEVNCGSERLENALKAAM